MNIHSEAIELITPELIKRYGILPLGEEAGCIRIAMSQPYDLQAIDDLSHFTGRKIIPCPMIKEELEHGIKRFILDKNALVRERASESYAPDNQTKEFLDSVLLKAVEERASDIHLEPSSQSWRVRFRIDGNLIELIKNRDVSYQMVISKLKIMAGLDIAKRREPLEGSFNQWIAGKSVDFRLVTMPTLYGEKAVLRILDSQAIQFSLEELGYSQHNLARVRELLKRPSGLILVTGPTGSGKTTTLYSMANELNRPELSISTLEDPIEYTLKGITQIPVMQEYGITYAEGLKSLLRQDPDIILIGEIRDLETARIALQASVTGHLVLASVHTNSAPQAVSRLLDLKVEPYLIKSGLIGVISQRLIRIKCQCNASCTLCNYTGYLGRTSIQEVLIIDEALAKLVDEDFDERAFYSLASKTGYIPLIEAGEKMCLAGITDKRELARVIYCP